MVRLLTLKRLFAKVELASLEQVEASYSGLGPRHYPVKACFFALVLMHLLNMPSETMLAGYLSVHGDVAEACGFNHAFKRRRGTPSQSALNRFKHRVGVEGFERLFEELTRRLMKAGVAKGRWIVVDSSAVDAYFHSDPDARWGYTDVDKPFFGYKLHILVDSKSELPLAFRVTPGNVHDSQEYLNLLDDVEEADTEHAYGDAAYDSEALRMASLNLYDLELHTPRNPRRRGGRARSSKTFKRMKSIVERVFSRLKLLRFKDLKVKGFASAAIHFLLALVTMLVVALSATGNRLNRKIRCIRSLAA